jgi:23S rRNA (adenine2503-C2)-methyltransferase
MQRAFEALRRTEGRWLPGLRRLATVPRQPRATVRLDDRGKFPVVGAPLEELGAFLESVDVRPAHARTVFELCHRRLAPESEIMEALPSRVAQVIGEKCSFERPEIVEEQVSEQDGTHKWLMRVAGGHVVETVFIPEAADRGVLCVSSSVGCALTCTFCHTGTQQLERNLTPMEITGQFLSASARLRQPITNIVMMGMGEPLLNWRSSKAFAKVMLHSLGGGIPPRRFTISTSGVAPAIPWVASELGCSLALSLHAPTDELRSRIMPLNRTWNLEAVMRAVREYTLAPSPLPGSKRRPPKVVDPSSVGPKEFGKRSVLIEYVMLDEVNDAPQQARDLAALVKNLSCHVNLIPFNYWEGAPYRCPSDEAILSFGEEVLRAGVSCSVRWPKGRDIMAACGQLHSHANRATELVVRSGGTVVPPTVPRQCFASE